jgi:hypothetical protein
MLPSRINQRNQRNPKYQEIEDTRYLRETMGEIIQITNELEANGRNMTMKEILL